MKANPVKLYRQIRKVRDVLHAETATVANDARTMAPSRTGALKNSIIRRRTRAGGQVIARTPYAVYVEFTEQSYMRPALDRNRDSIISAVKRYIKSIKE